MKRALWVFTLQAILLTAVVIAENKYPLEALGGVWELGDVEQSKTKEKQFSVKNVSDKPVKIRQVRGCCGYSILDISTFDIQPGKEAGFVVQVDARNKMIGNDVKAIRIEFEDPAIPELSVKVTSSIVELLPDPAKAVPVITPEQLYRSIQDKEATVIFDVRERSEFTEKHIENAVNLPRSEYNYDDKRIDEMIERAGGGKKVFIYCGGGARSSFITRKMRERGFDAYNLSGGLSAWESVGLPVIYGPKSESVKKPIYMSIEEAFDDYYGLHKRDAVWIDVRDKERYAAGHITGAINIPVSILKTDMSMVPKDKNLVLYCDSADCGESNAAGVLLLRNGYDQGKVRHFKDGYIGWMRAGYPVTGRSKN